MKKFFLGSILLLLVVFGFLGWRLFGPATAFSGESYNLYIRTGMTYPQLLDLLEKDTVLKSPAIFNLVAGRLHYPDNVRAGKYEIKKGSSLLTIVRMLKNGRQTPVHIVITKFRTSEGFSGAVGRKLECDSSSISDFIHNNDSLRQFGVDSNTFLTIVMPNTYIYNWNIPASAVFKKMYTFSKSFWTAQRVQEARAKDLTPVQAYILASIVEEETNAAQDKGKIASVYMNRMRKGIKLGADPTVKYAMRDFELKRIYEKYLKTESPYNTYLHDGLPPGPICTPSEATIDAVLQAPSTDYLYFVAKPDNSGLSNFAATFQEHEANAKAYRTWLDTQMSIRAAADSAKAKK